MIKRCGYIHDFQVLIFMGITVNDYRVKIIEMVVQQSVNIFVKANHDKLRDEDSNKYVTKNDKLVP